MMRKSTLQDDSILRLSIFVLAGILLFGFFTVYLLSTHEDINKTISQAKSLVELTVSSDTNKWVGNQFSKECGKLFYKHYSGGPIEDYKCITIDEWVYLYHKNKAVEGKRVLEHIN